MAKVQEKLDAFRASFVPIIYYFQMRVYSDFDVFDVSWFTLKITWTITLTSLSATWSGGSVPLLGVSVGVITIAFSGPARTEKPQFNWDFDGTASLLVTFDAATQSLSFALLGAPTVHFSGPFGAIVESQAKTEVEKILKAQIQNAINQFSGLMTFASQATELTTQLTTLAGPSDVHFDEAIFSSDGLIVRGPVTLVPRRRPVHAFETTVEQDGFTAVGSWIPGGRVDAFDWSWNWFNNGGDPGTETDKDRFILRRPREQSQQVRRAHGTAAPIAGPGRYGDRLLECERRPGSSGHRRMGARGDRAAFAERFGIELTLTPPGLDRLFMKEFGGKPRDPIGPIAEVAVHRVDGRNPATRSANTLVIFAGGSSGIVRPRAHCAKASPRAREATRGCW